MAKVAIGMFEGSDHYAVLAKIKLKARWKYDKRKGKVRGDM